MSTYYCVINTGTADVLYCGVSQSATAAALEPGTIYGFGRTKFAAWLDAIRRRREVLGSPMEEPRT